MLVCLVGKMGTGKTAVANKLMEKYGYERVVTCTSRPPRPGETNGVDYHFIRPEDFREEDFLEWKAVQRDDKVYIYGTRKDAVKRDKRQVIVLTPEGLRDFVRAGAQVIGIELTADADEVAKRLIRRGDDAKAARSRQAQEETQFADLGLLQIENRDIGETAEEIFRCATYRYHSLLRQTADAVEKRFDEYER